MWDLKNSTTFKTMSFGIRYFWVHLGLYHCKYMTLDKLLNISSLNFLMYKVGLKI